ncbi:MAG: hypothetical protein N2169_00095 [bacterium]|nr:hypothetical protein [bacterium]
MKRLCLFILFLLFFGSFTLGFEGNLTSKHVIQIPEKKLTSTILLNTKVYSKFYSSPSEVKISVKLYDVEIKIYKEDKIQSIDKYDIYEKNFIYTLESNKLIDKNDEDNNPWNFIKPLIIIYNLRKDFKLITNKSEFTFSKKSDKFHVTENYNGLQISDGFIAISQRFIKFELNSNLPKNQVRNLNYTIKSTIKANVELKR